MDTPDKSAQSLDLYALSNAVTPDGPQWGTATEDLNVTVLRWSKGHTIAPHVNNEVDVLIIAIDGKAEMTVDGADFKLAPGIALLVPKGAERSLRVLSDTFSYLSVHRRRRGLFPAFGQSEGNDKIGAQTRV